MCLLLTAEGGARPSDEELEAAARTNDDGAGVAWPEQVDGEPMIGWEKGLDVEDVKRLVPELPHPFVVHFRKTSAGDSTDNLCHPFPINATADDAQNGYANRVLFHNGTVADWKDLFQSFVASRPVTDIPHGGLDNMSDTRAMAYMIHHATQVIDSDTPKLSGESILRVFDEQSRFVILDAEDLVDPDRDGLRHMGQFWYQREIADGDEPKIKYVSDTTGKVYEGGLLFSNRSWRSSATTR